MVNVCFFLSIYTRDAFDRTTVVRYLAHDIWKINAFNVCKNEALCDDIMNDIQY